LNRYALLHETSDLSVSRFDHPPHEPHEDPDEEVGARWSIAFVVKGSFDIVARGSRRRLRPGSVLLTHPGFAFRCRHPERSPTDVCVSIGFEPRAISDVEHLWERSTWTAREFPPPRIAYAQRRVRHALAEQDAFEIERWALAALTALQQDAEPRLTRGRYAARRTDVDAIVAVSREIERDATSRRSVADRARDVGFTSAQLTRGFRRYVGASPHEYVIRWRVAAAAELLDTGRSVSESCYRAGFENLSHFCRTFQRILGARASMWRALSLRERRRRVRALTALGVSDARSR